MDVESLYTCIPNDIGLTSISKYLSQRAPQSLPTNELLLERLFQIREFLQTRGTAMGTAAAPAYTFLVVAHWE